MTSEQKPHSTQALDIARKLVARDAETSPERRRIEVGRGGLMLLATRLIELEEQYEGVIRERDELENHRRDNEEFIGRQQDKITGLLEQLEAALNLIHDIHEANPNGYYGQEHVEAFLAATVESEGDHDAGHSAQAGQTASVAPSESPAPELRSFIERCDQTSIGLYIVEFDRFMEQLEVTQRFIARVAEYEPGEAGQTWLKLVEDARKMTWAEQMIERWQPSNPASRLDA